MKLSPILLLISSHFASAATVTIGGSSFLNFLDSSGATLPVESRVQIGFFLGLVPTKDSSGIQTNGPATFGQTQWDTFTPFDSTLFGTTNFGTGFESVLNASYTFDTDTVAGLTFPAFVGFRIFDTTSDDLTDAMFNTVARTVSTWEFNDPTTIPANPAPSPSIPLDVTAGTIFWEDNANPFQTSIAATAVPEPSSSVTALLGFALLLGARRRK